MCATIQRLWNGFLLVPDPEASDPQLTACSPYWHVTARPAAGFKAGMGGVQLWTGPHLSRTVGWCDNQINADQIHADHIATDHIATVVHHGEVLPRATAVPGREPASEDEDA